MLALRKMTPGGYEYLTGSVACADHQPQPGETMADYYLGHGYPPGQWIGTGADTLGITGEVTQAHMLALFGEGRHPRADDIMADHIADGARPNAALTATKLGRRFPQYGGEDALRRRVGEAYKQHNLDHDRPIGAPLKESTRRDIRDRVYREAFADDHDGRAPEDVAELDKWLAEQKKDLRNATAGYELVFAPDKSVSAAWALADPDTSERIADAHRQAVRDTVGYFERHVAFTRQGFGGPAQVDVQGVTAAVFEHWDSRTGDPHLHTHVPVSVKVQRATDGQWTSLDGRTVHAAAVTVSEFYNNRIRDLLREQGASFVQRPAEGIDLKRPVWELEGIPTELTRAWSQRTQQVETDRARRIVQFRREHGREPDPKELLELGKRAQYGTRAAKAAPRTLSEHRSRWQAFADALLGTEVRGALVGQLFSRQRETDSIDLGELAAGTRAVVSEHHATFNRWNLEAEAHRQTAGLHLTPGQREDTVASIVESIVSEGDTVHLQSPSLVAEPQRLRRRSGECVFAEHNADRYTTHATLREEQALVSFARQRGGQRLTTDTIAAAMATSAARGKKLNPAQERMVTEFARSGTRLQGALAPAGTGKTTAMRVFADAWRSAGGRVYAFGPSARAAQELGHAIDAPPHTLHQVTTAQRHGLAEKAFPFARGDVLVIDEFAMAGTHTLHSVVDYAIGRGADVRLVGDDRQMTAVEAGGFARLLDHDVGVLRLREVVRFHDPDQGEASLLLRAGNPNGLAYYEQQGWLSGGSIETMRAAAQHAWRRDLDNGRETLLIVPRNEDVVALNLQAHAQRVERGDINTRKTRALHDGTEAGGGDWIVTRRNNRQYPVFGAKDFVKNGDTWTIQRIHRSGALTVQHREHGGTAYLPADYTAEHVELAYAATINRVQGMTVRHSAHTVVTPETTREQFYPGLTRAQGENRGYVVTSHHVADSHQETPPEQDITAVLTGVLKHSGAELSATETLRDNLGEAESLATLVLRHEFTADLVARERYTALINRVLPEAATTDATPALVQTLHTAETQGWQAERLLPRAIAQGPLTDANDTAAVLIHRIQNHTEHHSPPARIADPSDAELGHWRALITKAAPQADVHGEKWNIVWQHAAAGQRHGLDTDTALTQAASRLAQRPDSNRTSDARFTGEALVAALAQQQRAGHGEQPALPWLTQHHRNAVEPVADAELGTYLTQLDTAISARTHELHAQVIRDQPDWAHQLGPRPERPDHAEGWDHAIGLAAAYRETYRLDAADQPVGPRPDGHGPQARAWKTVTEHWRNTMTTPENDALHARTQQRIDAMQNELGDDKEDAHRAATDTLTDHRIEHRYNALEERDTTLEHHDEIEDAVQDLHHRHGMSH